MAVLSLLQAITSVAAAHKAPADTQDVMSKRLSLIVDGLLKCTWQQEDEAEEDTLSGELELTQLPPQHDLVTIAVN